MKHSMKHMKHDSYEKIIENWEIVKKRSIPSESKIWISVSELQTFGLNLWIHELYRWSLITTGRLDFGSGIRIDWFRNALQFLFHGFLGEFYRDFAEQIVDIAGFFGGRLQELQPVLICELFTCACVNFPFTCQITLITCERKRIWLIKIE